MQEKATSREESVSGVNILDPKQLLQFAQDKSEHGRRNLAGAISSFFDESEINDAQRALASEILLNLIRQAEIDLRQALAERLAVQESVPTELVVFLAHDEISVAGPVLLHSRLLNDVDLMYVISAKGGDHWSAIARREDLSPMVADRLIDTGHTETVLNLIENQRVRLQRGSMKKLARAALRSQELQAPLLRRPEVTPDVAVDLYMVVSQSLRAQISERFNIQAHAVSQAMDALVQELCHEAKGHRHTTSEMIALAQRFAERSDITPDLMVKTLRRGQVGFFIALFAEKSGFSPDTVVSMIQKEGGKNFVVACRHVGMMKAEFASIFLLSRGIRSGDKIVDQRELAMALKLFDALKDLDVQRQVKLWEKNGLPTA